KMNEVLVRKYLGDFYFHCDCRGASSLTVLRFMDDFVEADKRDGKEQNDNVYKGDGNEGNEFKGDGNEGNEFKDNEIKGNDNLFKDNEFKDKGENSINNDASICSLPDNYLFHIANAALCLSSSWDSKLVNPVYYVQSSQVSKTAPSGEYLPVGSFMIRGKKNYINVRGESKDKHNLAGKDNAVANTGLRLEYGIGVVFKKGNKITDRLDQNADHAMAVSGPWSLLKNYKFSAKLVPGFMKRKALIKKAVADFMDKGTSEERSFIGRIHVDEFYNVLIKGCKIGK
ncbi:Nuclear export mediator factor Nemf, partial [Dictyocoela roeselum]